MRESRRLVELRDEEHRVGTATDGDGRGDAPRGDVDDRDRTRPAVRRVQGSPVAAQRDTPGALADGNRRYDGPGRDIDDGDVIRAAVARYRGFSSGDRARPVGFFLRAATTSAPATGSGRAAT